MDLTKPHSIKDVFDDFKGRRNGLIKALTEEKNELFEACDREKENLCLYGYPDETWEVALPSEMVPPQLPEPVLGINVTRDLNLDDTWLSTLAAHSDSWLLSVAFHYGSRFGFDSSDRNELFQMINSLPTLLETMSRGKMPKVRYLDSFYNRGQSSSKKPSRQSRQLKQEETLKEESEEEEKEETEEEETEEEETEDDEHDKTLKYPSGYCNVKRRQSSEKTLPRRSRQLMLEKMHALSKENEESEEEEKEHEHNKTSIDPSGGHCNRKRRQSSEKTLPCWSQQLKLEGMPAASKEEEGEVKEDEEEDSLCGFCNEQDGEEFWIFCDWCDTWYHGNCVDMTPEKAKPVENYKCPFCCIKFF